jgi:hypothetical protein
MWSDRTSSRPVGIINQQVKDVGLFCHTGGEWSKGRIPTRVAADTDLKREKPPRGFFERLLAEEIAEGRA